MESMEEIVDSMDILIKKLKDLTGKNNRSKKEWKPFPEAEEHINNCNCEECDGICDEVRKVVMFNSLQVLAEISQDQADKWAILNAIKASFDAYYPEIEVSKQATDKLADKLAELKRRHGW